MATKIIKIQILEKALNILFLILILTKKEIIENNNPSEYKIREEFLNREPKKIFVNSAKTQQGLPPEPEGKKLFLNIKNFSSEIKIHQLVLKMVNSILKLKITRVEPVQISVWVF